MTLLVDRKESGPGIHAMVIGVGHYPHLEGGSTPRPDTLDLRQLTSPPVNALKVADWLRTKLSHPRAKLASVDLLVSARGGPVSVADDQGATREIDPATMACIRSGVLGWIQRAHLDAGNVALFYFCGHGVAAGLMSGLLAEDFGDDHTDRTLLANVVDLEELYLGMDQCRAEEQLFLIDACRATPAAIAERAMRGRIGESILTPSAKPRYAARDAPILYACQPGMTAYAQRDADSAFTRALLDSLDGAGAVLEGIGWCVRTDSLLRAVNARLRRLAGDQNLPPQKAVQDRTSGYVFHRLAKPPSVPLSVGCHPQTAVDAAELVVSNRLLSKRLPAPPKGRWAESFPAGSYDIAAEFPRKEFRDCALRDVLLHPPEHSIDLEVQQ